MPTPVHWSPPLRPLVIAGGSGSHTHWVRVHESGTSIGLQWSSNLPLLELFGSVALLFASRGHFRFFYRVPAASSDLCQFVSARFLLL